MAQAVDNHLLSDILPKRLNFFDKLLHNITREK